MAEIALRPRVRSTACPWLVIAAVWLAACGGDRASSWVEADGYRWRELDPRGSGVGFTSVDPDRAGVDFVNRFSQQSLLDNDILANGSGVALGDYDGDGRPDLYLTGVESPNALYRNLGGWRFEDVTAQAGVGLAGSVSRGAAWADTDGDGDLDLLVTRHSEPNVLFRNDGEAGFTNISAEAGFVEALASHSLALADVDADGDLDLYITNYKDRWARDAFPPEEREFDRVIGRDGDRYFVRPEFVDYFRVIETPTGPGRWEFGEPDEYYVNEGGRFTRVPLTDERFRDEAGAPFAVEPDEWGLSARFADLDEDGDPDLYVCNDINSPDEIWLNDGRGGFQLIAPLAIRKTSTASMAVDVADVDRDGHPDIFVAEMLSPEPRRRKMQVPEVDPEPARPGEIERRPQVKRNTLQMGRGDGTFAETAFQAGVAASGWTWGALFADVDLDGYEDLLLTNGNVLDWLDGDAQDRTRGVSGVTDWRALRLQFPRLEQSNRAFRNEGDGTFTNASARWGIGAEPDISQGIAAGDLDGDGDLDVVINRLDASPRLLRNEATAPRIAVRLRGLAPNTAGVGAHVRLFEDGVPDQETEVAEAGLYLSDSDGLVSFAAGGAGDAVLEVEWPGGGCTRLEEVGSNREVEIRQPPASGVAAGCGSADDRVANSAEPADSLASPTFEDVSGLLDHRHFEQIFVDEFTREPLMPLRLAQMGPGVSWFDDDGDGDPDLWVGAGRGGRVMRFANDGGVFRGEAVGPAAPGDVSSILPAPGGAAGSALAGQMNYEAPDPTSGIALASVVELRRSRATPIVEGAPSTTGPLAMADVDGDGDLDLFVGGRVIPSAYPIPATSRLLLADGGAYVPDPTNADLLTEIGLVSSAIFSDVDLDGDPDLLIAQEWGAVRLLRNDGGRFVDATAEWGLAGLVGRWNGIATGDLDGDGRPDVVVTGWGENTEAALGGAGQAALYGDFDRNGVLDIVELARDENGVESPALRLGQLGIGLGYLRRVTPDNHAYADADLETLLGPGLTSAGRVEAPELRHMILLNRGGSFEATPLPAEAQRAPAFGVAVADFDADGHEDVLLAQNFFATKLQTPRYDAGRALMLTGDGTGALEIFPSGIEAYGDGRGLALADFDSDGRVDVAIGQNGGPTGLWRNRLSGRGLRVRLQGAPANPRAIGAVMRVEYADGAGPAREIHAGSGYWSNDAATQVLGLRGQPVAVSVRWPGGGETRTPVASGDSEVTAVWPGSTP